MTLFRNVLNFLEDHEVIRTDLYLAHTSRCEYCIYQKSDFLYRRGEWRGKQIDPLYRLKKTENLILGHSDKFVGSLDLRFIQSLGFKQVYGVNVKPIMDFSRPLPLGLTNNTEESDLHAIFGNDLHLKTAFENADFPSNYRGRISGNFSIETNMKTRSPIAQLLDHHFQTFRRPDFSNEGRVRYLQNLAESNFVVCPPGNGIDTHRLWETLYMGSIPVVLRNNFFSSLLEGLPALIINDWKELLDSEFMERSWYDISQAPSYNFSKLSITYWIKSLHDQL